MHRFSIPSTWTVDREKKAFLIGLGGGGSPDDVGRMPYAVLVLDGQVIVFNLVERSSGSGTAGLHKTVEIHDLILPASLAAAEGEIKQLLLDALEEDAHCRPFADGGTVANPNMVARWNIKSFKVEFK